MDNNRIYSFIKRNQSFARKILKIYNCLLPYNKMRVKGLSNELGICKINGLKIWCSGNNNKLIIRDFVRIKSCSISITGDNNTIVISDNAFLNNVDFCMEDNNNIIAIGKHASLMGKTHLATIEGTKITIGDNCLLSSDIHFRTGDSHSIVNYENKRINKSKDIVIGNHVWIGTRVLCLKGTMVSDDSIVAAGSVLNKSYNTNNCIIGGVPGKIIKNDVKWLSERISFE